MNCKVQKSLSEVELFNCAGPFQQNMLDFNKAKVSVGSLICDGICQSAETMDDDVFEGLVASESPLVAVVVDLESVG